MSRPVWVPLDEFRNVENPWEVLRPYLKDALTNEEWSALPHLPEDVEIRVALP